MITLLLLACSTEPVVSPAPAPVPAPVEAPPAPPPGAAPAATGTPWVIDPSVSTVTASAHKLIGGHDLNFPGTTGALRMQDGVLVGLEVTVAIATLTTDAEKLTGHLLTPDFFDAATMPSATFTSTGVTGTAPAYTVTGDLSIHGKSKSVTFPATANLVEGVLIASAEVQLDRNDFSLIYPGKSDNLIQDGVELKVKLVAKAP